MTHAMPQTHWVNDTTPIAIPPGMQHAVIFGRSEDEGWVDTLASLTTRGSYGPRVTELAPDETPETIFATDEQLATAARYEQNIRELIEWSKRDTH